MERKDAEQLVNDTLTEINESRVKEVCGDIGLTALTPLAEFDSLDKTELIIAIQDEGIPDGSVDDDEVERLFKEGTLGDVYDIAEKFLPDKPPAE